MSIGQGIAVAGIWLGVGMVGFGAPDAAMFASMCALMSTLFVARG